VPSSQASKRHSKIRLHGSERFSGREIETGRPVVAFGPTGERLVFDRGRVRFTFYVDTLGDADLSNDIFLGAEDPTVAGPHPIFLGEADFCDLLDLLR